MPDTAICLGMSAKPGKTFVFFVEVSVERNHEFKSPLARALHKALVATIVALSLSMLACPTRIAAQTTRAGLSEPLVPVASELHENRAMDPDLGVIKPTTATHSDDPSS